MSKGFSLEIRGKICSFLVEGEVSPYTGSWERGSFPKYYIAARLFRKERDGLPWSPPLFFRQRMIRLRVSPSPSLFTGKRYGCARTALVFFRFYAIFGEYSFFLSPRKRWKNWYSASP